MTFAPDPDDKRATRRYLDQLVKLTPNGARAAQRWAPISVEVDKRWHQRFGKAGLDSLAGALRRVVSTEGQELPDSMPVVDYGNGMRATLVMPQEPTARTPPAKLDLSALLSRALLSLTLEYEREAEISLAAAANVLRVIDAAGTSMKDLPLRAGVAKEGQAALVKFLTKNAYLSLGADKAKTLKPTAKGKTARNNYPKRVAAIEKRWEKSVGAQPIGALRKALDRVLGDPKFIDGLKPHGGWRTDNRYVAHTEAVLADPRTALPHHPMITHRGGFPDGS